MGSKVHRLDGDAFIWGMDGVDEAGGQVHRLETICLDT